jgi:hypothetical protein
MTTKTIGYERIKLYPVGCLATSSWRRLRSVCAATADLGLKIGDHPVKSCTLINCKCTAVTTLDEVGERSL